MQKHSILPQAESFLKNTMNIPILKIEETYFEDYSFSIKDYNSMLTVTSDNVHIVVVACFETSLIDKIIKNFMGISKIDENEKEALYLDASGEIINIIINLANPKYIKSGLKTNVYVPVKITTIDDIKIPKEHIVLDEKIYTEFGNMNLSIVSSKNNNKDT